MPSYMAPRSRPAGIGEGQILVGRLGKMHRGYPRTILVQALPPRRRPDGSSTVDGPGVFATTVGTDFDPGQAAVVFGLPQARAFVDRNAWRPADALVRPQCPQRADRSNFLPATRARRPDRAHFLFAIGPTGREIASPTPVSKSRARCRSFEGALWPSNCPPVHPKGCRGIGAVRCRVEMPGASRVIESCKVNTLKVQSGMKPSGSGKKRAHKGRYGVRPAGGCGASSLAGPRQTARRIHADLAACNA